MSEVKTLVQAKDFESIKLSVSLTNLTSGDRRIVDAALLELSDDACVLGCPPRTAAKGHTVLLEVRFPGGLLKSTARVTENEEPSEADRGDPLANRLSLNLVQYEKNELEALKALLATRQNEISALMAAIKGY